MRWATHKPRLIDQVDAGVRRTIHDVCAGELPWPLVLLGETGAGKTCIGLLLADFRYHLYYTVGDWCARINAAKMGQLTNDVCRLFEPNVWDEWSGARLTVLDELGLRDPTSARFETVEKAIDTREGRPAVYISNLSLEVLQQVYDERISSRLSAGTVIEMSGDRRVKER